MRIIDHKKSEEIQGVYEGKRTMKKRLLYVFLVFIALLAILAGGSLKDEELSVGVKEVLKYSPPVIPPEENIFVGVIGFNAPSGSDFIHAGQKAIEKANAKKAPGFDDHRRLPTDLLFVPGKSHPLFPRDSSSCKSPQDKEIAIDEFRAQNHELLERYKALLDMPVFANTLSYADLSPSYLQLHTASSFFGEEALLKIHEGNVEEGLAFFEKNIAFYKGVLSSDAPKTLLDSLISIGLLKSNYQFLSELFSEESSFLLSHGERLRKMLLPIENPEKAFTQAMQMEKVFVLKLLPPPSTSETPIPPELDSKNLDFPLSILAKQQLFPFFYKRKATLNRCNETIDEQLARFQTINIRNFLQKQRKLSVEDKGLSHSKSVSFLYKRYGVFFWKNYIGELILDLNLYMPYFGKFYDIVAHANLVQAQLELRLAGIEGEYSAEALKDMENLPPNPYTGKPFSLDEEKKYLWFKDSQGRQTSAKLYEKKAEAETETISLDPPQDAADETKF